MYGPYLPDASQWTFAYVSAAQFGSHDTAKDFWDRVWQAFADKSVARPQEALLREMVDKWPPRTYGRNLRQLDQQQLRLVLLLEGMDKLTSKTRLFTFDLTSSLRTLSSREPSFSVVFSSRRRLSELNRLVATRGSPPFNNFDEILL